MTTILLANMSAQMMLCLATVLAVGLLMRRIAQRNTRSRSPEPLTRFRRDAKAMREHALELPLATSRCQVEMHELARDIQGELDTKMRILQILIDDARRESERLETLLAQGGAARFEPTRQEPAASRS